MTLQEFKLVISIVVCWVTSEMNLKVFITLFKVVSNSHQEESTLRRIPIITEEDSATIALSIRL